MLSFELSAIDLILVIAVVVLLVLYITRPSAGPVAEEKPLVEKENVSKKPVIRVARSLANSQKKSAKCPYSFGYLKKLGQDADIPDKCLSCPRIMECYSAD